MDLYFPSCNFNKSSPQAAKRLRDYMNSLMPVAGCCRVDSKDYPEGARALYFCQACRQTIADRFPALVPENLFVWLDREGSLDLPDYSGLKVSIQDCWRDRDHPEIHQAVRSLLEKMHIAFTEPSHSRSQSIYCGNLHYEPDNPTAKELIAARPHTPLYQFPEDEQRLIFREQVEEHGGLPALCYCNRCKLCLETAGGKAPHLMELLMDTYG